MPAAIASKPAKSKPVKNVDATPDIEPMNVVFQIEEICCVPGKQYVNLSIRGDMLGSFSRVLREANTNSKYAQPIHLLGGLLLTAGDVMFGNASVNDHPRLAPMVILPDGEEVESEPWQPQPR